MGYLPWFFLSSLPDGEFIFFDHVFHVPCPLFASFLYQGPLLNVIHGPVLVPTLPTFLIAIHILEFFSHLLHSIF
jgi:hypothetical protein